MHTSDSIVIIPTYNERENIENIIRAVMALEHGFHILVIEDGSPDGTADIVRSLQGEFKDRLHMVERRGKNTLRLTINNSKEGKTPVRFGKEVLSHNFAGGKFDGMGFLIEIKEEN